MPAFKRKQSEEHRKPRTFGQTLKSHLLQKGTRPAGSANVGTWQIKEFAEAVSHDPRSIYDWIRDRAVPNDLSAVEKALFGDDTVHQQCREELRDAYFRARNRDHDGSKDSSLYRLLRENKELRRQIDRLSEEYDNADDALIKTAIKTVIEDRVKKFFATLRFDSQCSPVMTHS
jgi:hypothetical protein